MKIIEIRAEDQRICLTADAPFGEADRIEVSGYAPALKEEEKYFTCDAERIAPCTVAIPRQMAGHDALYMRLQVKDTDGTVLGGVRYCETFDLTSLSDVPYPTADTKKGLQIANLEDAIRLGVKHAALNVAISDFMVRSGDNDAIPYEFDGETFYFDRKVTEYNDARLRTLTEAGVIVTLICLCAKHWTKELPEDMRADILHPDYDPEGTLSAFNVLTVRGIRCYMAYMAFLTHRYTQPGYPYGRAVGLIISNEVNSQWIWGNAGRKTVDQFAREYVQALRMACLASLPIYRHMRVYVSLDNFWNQGMQAENPEAACKFYGSRPLLEWINRLAKEEGDCYWNIAYHPYPQDLNYPDFWNDPGAIDAPDSPHVTFKNLSVLVDFDRREENLYKGIRRRIILSEQGFNSHWTMESEVLQAYAYGKAYHIVMQMEEIDSFILHAHHDNVAEFGLNLGLWRRFREEEGDPHKMAATKPIYDVFRAIDQKDEKGVYHWERY